MPLIASLWTGTSGLLTSSNALNTTAHNMSNLDTEGYTRQQVQQGTRDYNMINRTKSANAEQQVGLGVEYTSCRQVRSVFLDKSYRTESGRAAFYNVSYDCMIEAEDLLQEMNGAEFADSMDNLWRAIQDLDRDPANTVNMNTLISRAAEFTSRAKAVYQGLTNYQSNLDQTIDGYVKTINEYGKRISELNKEIVNVESGHREHANDIRDERNLLLDKLAELGRIDYSEDVFGNVLVYFEDTPFVMTDHVNTMAVDRVLESTSGYATPYWEYMATTKTDPVTGYKEVVDISAAKVYNLEQPISSSAGTDIGKLRSTLLARGDHNATYHDITGGDEVDADGNPIAVSDEIVAGFYNRSISQSVVMNIEAEFDQLIHNVVEKINEVIENAASNPARVNPEKWVTNDILESVSDKQYGKAYSALTADEKAVVDKAAVDQAAKQFDLFVQVTDDEQGVVRYDIGSKADNGQLIGYPAGSIRIGTTVTNIKINEELLRDPGLLSMRDIEGNEDKQMTEALKQAFRTEDYTLNPAVATKVNFVDYYNSLVSQVANSGDVYDSITDQQTVTVNTISSAREQIVGTSSDEELEFMIKFQNAYNAASRYINVVSEMLEHIVTTLGS
ncbi:MAG: flagellar hook-associated protein FlgK [Lachnospiraceae bacterium]|nr:flagellar hook-associated protein FlgK [Lachnospiraceae bacterium]